MAFSEKLNFKTKQLRSVLVKLLLLNECLNGCGCSCQIFILVWICDNSIAKLNHRFFSYRVFRTLAVFTKCFITLDSLQGNESKTNKLCKIVCNHGCTTFRELHFHISHEQKMPFQWQNIDWISLLIILSNWIFLKN